MFDRDYDHATTTFGLVLAATSLEEVMRLLGLAIGLGGFLCGVSREARAWLDRRAKPSNSSTRSG